jgi:hypothetical protein
MARSREMAKDSKARLLALVETLGESDPRVVKAWAVTHQAVCREILEGIEGTELDQEVQRFVARETLENWEKVRQGLSFYVSINRFTLKGYEEKYEKVIHNVTLP